MGIGGRLFSDLPTHVTDLRIMTRLCTQTGLHVAAGLAHLTCLLTSSASLISLFPGNRRQPASLDEVCFHSPNNQGAMQIL